MRKKKKWILGMASLLVVLVLGACGAGEEGPAPEAEIELEAQEEMGEKDHKLEAAIAEAYGAVLDKRESYDFKDISGPDQVTGYDYALVDMTKDEDPELLVRKNTATGISMVRVFAYDKDKESLLEPAQVLQEGVASGGFRGSVQVSRQGDGLLVTEGSSGSGQFYIFRVTITDQDLDVQEVDQFTFTQTEPKQEIGDETMKVAWYSVDDREPLEALAKGTYDQEEPEEVMVSQEPVQESREEAIEKRPAPVDEEHVLEGTVRVLSSEELLDLQGFQDPNPGGPSLTHVVLIFDQNKMILANSVDGPRTDEATMIAIDPGDQALLDQLTALNGQRVALKVGWLGWPSDTGLPLGEPRARDVEILG